MKLKGFPGHRTTHAAAILGARGRVLAFDRDPARLAILKERVALAAPGRVDCEERDFLATDALPSSIRAILLDPSCSGSGIVAVERAGAKKAAPRRVEKLANFQLDALTHALTAFPDVDRVAYSTCSVHVAENEAVVAAALRAAPPGWRLGDALPRWPRRGLADSPLAADARRVVRADPRLDGTHGFFVALFVRDAAATSNGGAKRPRANGAAALRNAKRKLKRKRRKLATDS